MKVKKAVFYFKDWKFIFTLDGYKLMHGRKYNIWKIITVHNGNKYEARYASFVPSTRICRIIKKSILTL